MSWRIRRATAADGDAILGLIEGTPQPGAVTLNFERRPDFFAGAGVSCETPDVWVAESEESGRSSLDAVVNIGWRRVFVDGEVRPVRYAHDMRIAPHARGGLLLYKLFRTLRSILDQGEWMQTVILDDNEESVNTIGSGRAGLPTYHPFGRIETSLLYTRAGRYRPSAHVRIRFAQPEDLPALRAFWQREGGAKQFFPWYDLEGLNDDEGYYRGLSTDNFILAEDREGIAGVVGFWDQKGFKQTRVVRYAPGLALLRHLYNGMSRLRGGMQLPPAGGLLSYIALHGVAVRDNDPDILRLLLDFCVHEFSDRCDALVCGFFVSDPLSRVPARYRRRVLHSSHFLVCCDRDPRAVIETNRTPYVDVARL